MAKKRAGFYETMMRNAEMALYAAENAAASQEAAASASNDTTATSRPPEASATGGTSKSPVDAQTELQSGLQSEYQTELQSEFEVQFSSNSDAGELQSAYQTELQFENTSNSKRIRSEYQSALQTELQSDSDPNTNRKRKSPKGKNASESPKAFPTDMDSPSVRWNLVTENARILFAFLIAADPKFLVMAQTQIRNKNGILMSVSTKWCCLKSLIKMGAVKSTKRVHLGPLQGTKFELDEELSDYFCRAYSDLVGASRTPDRIRTALQSGLQSEYQSAYQSESQSESDSATVSSSLIKEKKTTTDTDFPLLASHPEYSYWRDHGTSAKQISKWMEQFDISAELMDQYLRWAAFDLAAEESKGSDGKQIKSPQSWFYKILERSGCYSRPSGYESFEDKKIAAQEALQKERAERRKREEELLKKQAEEELMDMFDSLMDTGEKDPVYEELREKLPVFAKGNPASPVFRNMMLIEFKRKFGLN